MLSCRGKFKLFQGIQWINSIKVNSSSSSLLRFDQTSPHRGVFAMREPWLDIIPCQRCHLWQLPPPGVMAVVVKIWYFLNSLLQSLSLSVSPGQSSALMTSREKCAVAVLATVGREGESVRQKESTYGELPGRAGRNGSNHCCHLWPAISRSCTGERTQGNILIFGGILAASSNPQCWY